MSSITIEKSGQVTYKEAVDDERPFVSRLPPDQVERVVRPGRKTGSLHASAGIAAQSRPHGHQDVSVLRMARPKPK